MIEKTKRVQQSFDTIHDFYDLERGLFKLVLQTNVAKLQATLAAESAANPAGHPKITKASTLLQQGIQNAPKIPLYRAMRSIMQYMIITLNSITFKIPITPTPDIHTLSIDDTTNFGQYVGSQKLGQLFFTGDGKTPTSPKSGVSISDIEISGRNYFEIPEGRQWTYSKTGPNAKTSFINLVNVLFNINNNPDDDIKKAYNLALSKADTTPIKSGATLTNKHRIYMVCDAGSATYGKLAASVRPPYTGPGAKANQKAWDTNNPGLKGPSLTELYLPLSTADSASSHPYEDHEFVFVASDKAANPDVFISDANLYTSDIYEIRYERHKWHKATGLGFRLVIIRKNPRKELFALEYGVLGKGQSPFVKATVSTKDPPYIYNGQGPSAALLSGCILLRALNTVPQGALANTYIPGVAAGGDVKPAYKDIPEEKLNDTHGRIRAKVTDQPRKEIVTELAKLMIKDNGFSPLSTTAKMVDPYHLLGERFGEFPPELWLDIKRGGDRDQVKALHILSQQRDVSDNLVYPFIHFVTGDLLAAKMAVELGLAVIYLAGKVIRYWPKMFRFRPESQGLPSPHGITTKPAPVATSGDWAIARWGGKQMKGGLRNPISEDIGWPPYTHIEDYEGIQYTYSDLVAKNIPKIILHGLWLHPSEYVFIKSHRQILPEDLPLFHYRILDSFITLLQIYGQDPQTQELLQPYLYLLDYKENIEQILTKLQEKEKLEPQIAKQQELRRLHLQQGMHELTVLKRNRYTEATRMALASSSPQALQGTLKGLQGTLEGLQTTIDPLTIIPSIEPILLKIPFNDPRVSDALQAFQLAHPNNSGIYQYDFINEHLYADDPRVNDLDTLTFKVVNYSKEDDGLEGAALIGENSPAVHVIPVPELLPEIIVPPVQGVPLDPWTIPALLDENLLIYDITFMVKQFLTSVVLYYNDTTFTKPAIHAFMNEETDDGRVFMEDYGINPVASYIKAKYHVEDNALEGLKQRIRDYISSTINIIITEFRNPELNVINITGENNNKASASSSSSAAAHNQSVNNMTGDNGKGANDSLRSAFAAAPVAAPAASSVGPSLFTPLTYRSEHAASASNPFGNPMPAATASSVGRPIQAPVASSVGPFQFGSTIQGPAASSVGPFQFSGPFSGQSQLGQRPLSLQPTPETPLLQRTQSLQPTPSTIFGQFSSSSSRKANLTRKATGISGPNGRFMPIKKQAARAREQGIFTVLNFNKANQQSAKRSKKTLFATTGATASAVRVGHGGRRRTQKNHKRKKHGTQRKRSHKGPMPH